MGPAQVLPRLRGAADRLSDRRPSGWWSTRGTYTRRHFTSITRCRHERRTSTSSTGRSPLKRGFVPATRCDGRDPSPRYKRASRGITGSAQKGRRMGPRVEPRVDGGTVGDTGDRLLVGTPGWVQDDVRNAGTKVVAALALFGDLFAMLLDAVASTATPLSIDGSRGRSSPSRAGSSSR